MRRGSILRLIIVGLLVGAAATAVALFIPWLPENASKEGERIDFVFWVVTAICIGIFAVVSAIMLYAIVKFRVRPDDDSDGPPIHGHTGIEIAWTAIPTVLVVVIAIVSTVALAENGKLKSDRLVVEVTARQFAWSFKYPQYGGIESGTLRLPENRQVELRLRALDVIHSFWVPQFRQKQDAVPAKVGQFTTVPITPIKTGADFTVICAELCGLGHALMRAPAVVVKPPVFEAWAHSQEQRAAGNTG